MSNEQFKLFEHVTADDFGRVQPGDFDPDLDMVGEIAALDKMCKTHLGRPFDQCAWTDAAIFPAGDPKNTEITERYNWCAEGGGRRLDGFGARFGYYLVEAEEAFYIFARWEYDSVFVLSNLDTPEA